MNWISILLILVAFGLYGLLHSVLAGRGLKLYLQHRFPRFHRYYRFIYSAFATITLLPVVWLVWKLPDQVIYQIPFPWVILTGLIQLMAAVVSLFGVVYTGPFTFIGIRQILEKDPQPEKLRLDGLYRFMRHPIYSLGLVFMWLFPYMTQNLFSLWIAITIYILIGARLEERKLLVDFPEYHKYQKQVPMFIPRKAARIHPPPD